jgi:hypothetical protein
VLCEDYSTVRYRGLRLKPEKPDAIARSAIHQMSRLREVAWFSRQIWSIRSIIGDSFYEATHEALYLPRGRANQSIYMDLPSHRLWVANLKRFRCLDRQSVN